MCLSQKERENTDTSSRVATWITRVSELLLKEGIRTEAGYLPYYGEVSLFPNTQPNAGGNCLNAKKKGGGDFAKAFPRWKMEGGGVE